MGIEKLALKSTLNKTALEIDSRIDFLKELRDNSGLCDYYKGELSALEKWQQSIQSIIQICIDRNKF